MPSMILLPNGQNNVSSDWTPLPAPNTVNGALQSDDGDTSYVSCDDSLAYMVIEFADPTVAEADIDTIDSVRFLSSGRSLDRTVATRVAIDFEVPSGNPSENTNYAATRSAFTTINGTARATKDGTHDWDYAALESLEMKCTKIQAEEVYLSYLALEVTYTEAAADNATFFGANF